MNLVNVAIENLGAKIKTYSSFIDNLHLPTNILQSTEDSLWATSQGLPQFVIVSLQDLNVNFRNINEVGFMLWHDYETNPKSIELWVAETTDQQFAFWAEFSLDQKKGIQLFEIQPLPNKFIYLKISITQTYGAFETYLNQVFLMAEQVAPIKKITTQKDIMLKKKKQLDLEDLQSNLQQLIQMDKKITRSKSKSNKKKKQKVLNKNIRESDLSEPKNIKKNQKKKDKNQFSKGSLSSNRPGLSIYYRESQHLPSDQSREYVSNDYQSSSSNGLSKNVEMKKKQTYRANFNDSSEFLNSLQSKSIGLSPSLNYNTNSNNSYSISGNQKISQQQHKSQKYLKQNEKIRKNLYQSKQRKLSQNQEEQQVQQVHTSKQDEVEDKQSDNDEQKQFSNDIIKNTPKYNQVSQQNEEQYEQQSQEQQSQQQYTSSQQHKNYNVALLALSKHVVNLEDNMEAIQRKVQVLDMKVLHSHQKIQKELLEKVQNKVQQIVDRKLKRIWSVKNVFKILQDKHPQKEKSNQKDPRQRKIQDKRTFENQNQKFNYKKNLTKEFFKSDYHEQQRDIVQQQRDKTKTKRRMKQNLDEKQKVSDYAEIQENNKYNRLKTSKSFANITNKNRPQGRQQEITRKQNQNSHKQGPNQQYIADLLEKLNAKLKERQVKLNKMQHRQKQKQRLSRKIQQNDQKYTKTRKEHYKRAVTNNCNDYY